MGFTRRLPLIAWRPGGMVLKTRRLFSTAAVAFFALSAGAALAQNATSLDPLGEVVESFAAGDGLPMTQPGEGPIVRQFQMVVNLGEKPTFPTTDVEIVPRGFDTDGNLASLEEFFRGTLGGRSLLPPLAPGSAIGGMLGPETLHLDGWSAFGEFGPLDGPIDVTEGPTVVWGVELAEPFDPTCSVSRAVGRVWSDSFLGDPETPFAAGDLTNRFGSTYESLAGEGSRILQLSCEGGPSVGLFRLKDTGIRPLSPNKTTALVKDDLVLFFTPMRQVGDLTGSAFANGTDGGAIAVSSWTGEVPLLVPNPYDRFPIRIDLRITPRDGGQVPGGRTLVFRPGDATFVTTGTDCAPAETVIYSGPLDEDARDLFLQTRSAFAPADVEGSIVTVEFPNDFGGTDTVRIDLDKQTFTVTRTVGSDGPAEEACEGEGEAQISGTPAVSGGEGAGSGDGGPPPIPTNQFLPEEIPEPIDTSGGGVPWGPVAAVAAGAVAVVAGGRRLRSRTRNCRPETLAFDRAYDEANAALEVLRQAEQRVHEAGVEVSRLRGVVLRAEVPAPIKPYPFTPEAEARYNAEMQAYDANQAAAVEAREQLQEAESRLADVNRAYDEARVAHRRAVDAVHAAHQALAECRQRLNMAPPPPPALDEPDEPGPEEGEPPEREGDCRPGEEEWRRESSGTFTVPGGVRIRTSRSGAGWSGFQAGYGGTIPPDVFLAMGADTIAELSQALESNESVLATRSVVSAEIDIVDVTFTCERLFRCEGGQMQPTDQVRQRQTNSVRTETRRPSTPKADVEAMVRFVRSLQAEVTTLQESAEAIASFECD